MTVGLREVGRQVICHDSHLRLRVGNVVAQLVGAVHRVHRHHHGVGTQNTEMGHHQLRCVLHHQDHAVAAFHSQLLEVGREALYLRQQLSVAGGALQKHQGRFIGITPRACE